MSSFTMKAASVGFLLYAFSTSGFWHAAVAGGMGVATLTVDRLLCRRGRLTAEGE